MHGQSVIKFCLPNKVDANGRLSWPPLSLKATAYSKNHHSAFKNVCSNLTTLSLSFSLDSAHSIQLSVFGKHRKVQIAQWTNAALTEEPKEPRPPGRRPLSPFVEQHFFITVSGVFRERESLLTCLTRSLR